jgi:ubiquinone biosynthesis protein COQ4
MARENRIRPVEAVRALRALLRNPDDTTRVFEVIRAMSGTSGQRSYRRFTRTAEGARILAERRDLLALLSDRERLLALPSDSLGRSYAEFMGREELSAAGLVAASEQPRDPEEAALPAEQRLFFDRLRDSHDLWHVVTGYNRDLAGEVALLAFTFVQTRNPGIALIVATVYWRARGDFAYARRLIRGALRRALRAAWLPAQDWEALLARPLAEVRRELRVGEPPAYAETRSAGAPLPSAS